MRNISTSSLVSALVEASLHGIKAKGGHTSEKSTCSSLDIAESRLLTFLTSAIIINKECQTAVPSMDERAIGPRTGAEISLQAAW